MERPGERLKRERERLGLTYRDVVAASQKIAARRMSDEYSIALSRLADIENQGTLPTIYRLYTLCAIYRLDFEEVLGWFGVALGDLPSDALEIGLEETHAIHFRPTGQVPVPTPRSEIDLEETSFLGYLLRRWGKLPLSFLKGLDLGRHCYGFIGLSDRTMWPILQPGSLVVIDVASRKIASTGWTNEFERPIYFLEHRSAYLCGWCALAGKRLVVEPHPISRQKPAIFEYPSEIDVIGQVIGVAMPLESERRSARPYAIPAESRGR
jgi:transcriptional regulator with XRE-family HTH domain